MEKSSLKKPDAASETSVFEKATSDTPSSTADNFKQPTTLLHSSQEERKDGQVISENYSSNSSSSSTSDFSISQRESFIKTGKTTSDFTCSPSFSLSESSISETEEYATTAKIDIEPLGTVSSPSSTETIEIILRQSSKKNVFPISQHQASNASISADELSISGDSLGERKQTETSEPNMKTPFAFKDSMSSVSLSILRDNSELDVERKDDSSDDGKTVRFSLQDTEFADNSEHLPDLLKTSKSQHVTRQGDDDSPEDEDSMESTNLKIGHVFVYMVVPPDGGYGWFICFISFLCQIVIDGVVYSIGILLPYIAKDFNKTGSEVILISSLQIGFYFLSGTVASAFINKYGFRPVALTGAVLSITFLTLATFSINLPMLILFYSILGGPALSLLWVSSQLVIGYYFDRYRPIANGASCSGAGVGIMLFSLLNSTLVPEFGWRNLLRLHAACLVLVLLMTLSFVEVAPSRIGRVKESLAEDTESESLDIFYGLTNYSRFSLKVNNQEYPLDNTFETTLEKPTVSEKYSAYCDSCLQKCCPCLKRLPTRTQDVKPTEEGTKRYVIRQDPIEKRDFFYAGPRNAETNDTNAEELLQSRLNLSTSRDTNDSSWRILSLEEIDNAFKRRTIIRTLSSRRITPVQEANPYRLTYAELRLTEKRPILAFLSPRNWLHPKIQTAFRLLFDFRLLATMEFRILLLSAFLFPMGFNIPFVYSTVRAQIDASFAKLITPTIGLSNFAFRIASGFVAFKFREYPTYICGGGMLFGGFAVFVSAFYGLDVVWFQFLYALCYGIAPACFSTLRAIIYVQALGLDKLTNAFGLTALAMGLGVFIGTTAGGVLNDLTGTYTASFIFAGICICTAGALKLLLPYFIKAAKKKAGKRNN